MKYRMVLLASLGFFSVLNTANAAIPTLEISAASGNTSTTGPTTSSQTNTYLFNSTRFNLGMLNSLPNNPLANSFRSQRLNFFSVHNRVLSVQDIRKLHLGAAPLTTSPIYHFDFTNLVADGSNRRIVNTGTGTIDDVRLENHTNLLTPLFP